MEECELQDKRYEKYVKAIEHIDILLSHDAPYGTSDVLLQKEYRYADGSHIGNKSLTSFIEKTQPDFCFHGHLHSTNHDEELLKNSKVFNASLLDEFYNIVYKPLYIEID
jgi:Icc-related predicted phosphoesterase